MTTKEHLKAFHTASASHHVAMAKSHKRLAGHYTKATELDGHKDLADEHAAMADSHTQMAEHHLEMCKGIDDEMGKLAGDRLIPDRVSGITTHFPTMVPRYGAPDRSQRPQVPVEFEKLVSTGEDE